eukprot:CAMPEP_0119359544 /NCGR_PEP_ID=MMETSP1334-20130426/7410_1 /TAXON_ID=127549 /ORGANISM="Calcidiscus leptoporus, Strain RCC1130" /LENGTH=149 /DNA_ID=CAMNT_0007374241 /DNA_START=128 /DNA_END=578 /DNA_ORIENTATION=+
MRAQLIILRVEVAQQGQGGQEHTQSNTGYSRDATLRRRYTLKPVTLLPALQSKAAQKLRIDHGRRPERRALLALPLRSALLGGGTSPRAELRQVHVSLVVAATLAHVVGVVPLQGALYCSKYVASSRLEVEALSSGVESSHLKAMRSSR